MEKKLPVFYTTKILKNLDINNYYQLKQQMNNSNLGNGKGGDADSHIETGAPLPNFNTNIQLATIAPVYGIQSQQQPDYLDYDQKGRGIVSTMFTNSGISYLGGVIVGGVYGLQEGLRNTPSSRWKVKLNSVLNHCGRYGSQVGNMMGATAILYSLYEGLADSVSFFISRSPRCPLDIGMLLLFGFNHCVYQLTIISTWNSCCIY